MANYCVLSKKEFNRSWFCRMEVSGFKSRLVGFDELTQLINDRKWIEICKKLSVAGDVFVCKPLHGFKFTFIAH